MVWNKLCWNANDAVRLSNHRKVGLGWQDFFCFEGSTPLFASSIILCHATGLCAKGLFLCQTEWNQKVGEIRRWARITRGSFSLYTWSEIGCINRIKAEPRTFLFWFLILPRVSGVQSLWMKMPGLWRRDCLTCYKFVKWSLNLRNKNLRRNPHKRWSNFRF